MMSELGGPLPHEGLDRKLEGIVRDVETGKTWYRVIVTEGESVAGTVCVWDHDKDGTNITEIGWMVLPEFQGRGLATDAVLTVLADARTDRRWREIHAFPGVTNAASNAICRRTGFRNLGELDFEYAGRTLRCNDWVIELREPPTDGPAA